MDLTRIHHKIGEAHFFLQKMAGQEPRLMGDKVHFDYYLSAFLNATMSMRNRFQVRNNRKLNTKIRDWREKWEGNLNPTDKSLYDYLREDRVAEVHDTGSRRNVGREGVELAMGENRIEGGMVIISGPPGMEPAVAYRPTYSFRIKGVDRKVTEACREYLALLQRMATDFSAANLAGP